MDDYERLGETGGGDARDTTSSMPLDPSLEAAREYYARMREDPEVRELVGIVGRAIGGAGG